MLDFKEYEALLISYYGLDCQKYHNVPTDIKWEYCDLRKWLNNDFIKLAFSEEEVKKIKVSELKNEYNPECLTRGGNNTKDRIFCLSINEAEHYFGSDNDRQCKPTAYAEEQGAYVGDNDCCVWWLRSPGFNRDCAANVNTFGALRLRGNFVNVDGGVVRPALRIILDKHREELERKQREELERRQLKELQAQIYKDFLAIIKTGIRKGMIIPFGSYPQKENGCRVPIEWLVLDFNEKTKEALLVSRYGLDCKEYHNVSTDITWEDCDLRKWLNNDFIKSAFSEEEAKKIKVSELKNEDNPEYRTRGGNNTKDRIFCLSINEAEHYFGSDNDRQCKPTAYAEEQGHCVDRYGICFWWLRSPGHCQDYAAFVNSGGALRLSGSSVDFGHLAVRPALRIICNL